MRRTALLSASDFQRGAFNIKKTMPTTISSLHSPAAFRYFFMAIAMSLLHLVIPAGCSFCFNDISLICHSLTWSGRQWGYASNYFQKFELWDGSLFYFIARRIIPLPPSHFYSSLAALRTPFIDNSTCYKDRPFPNVRLRSPSTVHILNRVLLTHPFNVKMIAHDQQTSCYLRAMSVLESSTLLLEFLILFTYSHF